MPQRSRMARYSLIPAFVISFPEPVTELAVMNHGLHLEVMVIISFVVCFVSYALLRIIYLFKVTDLGQVAKQLKLKSLLYLEFF